jgi:hypothetical protein
MRGNLLRREEKGRMWETTLLRSSKENPGNPLLARRSSADGDYA